MLQIYRDGGQGAIKLAGVAEPSDTLADVAAGVEAAAAELRALIADGWELEAPMRGNFGLIHKPAEL